MTRLFAWESPNAHMLLRRAAGVMWGLEALPQMARNTAGKPYFPDHPDLCFNLSHSGSRSLCALSDGPVGVDIETVRPRRALLPRAVLSDGEYAWFLARGGAWEDFYTLWTLKEAKVKAQGTGINRPARTITVPPLGPGESGVWDGLHFTAYSGAGWRAALCSPADTALIEWFSFS